MAETRMQTALGGAERIGTFAALKFLNFRLWFFGQTLSMMGTWMQSVAQGWLVYQLTGSEFALGAVSFAGALPTLFLMLPGGVLADRIEKRRLLLLTQGTMMILAFVLMVLASQRGVLRIWHIVVLAIGLGIANSFDAPARQAMAVEMVEDRRYLMNAIALNSTIFNMARVVGPAVGGAVLAALGAAWCFGLNGLSYVAVIIALLLMRFPPAPAVTQRGAFVSEITDGVRYVWGQGLIRSTILLVSLASLFAGSFAVLLPAYAADVLKVGAAGLGGLNAGVGVGALAGSLIVASSGHFRRKGLILAAGALAYPIALLAFAGSRSLLISLVCLLVVGLAFVAQNSMANTIVQSLVPDELRGRVMGFYMLTFFGTAPFGALQAGSLAQALGTRNAIAIDASLTLAISVTLLLATPALRTLEI
ncbi:MAG TPA: MFS transporter [Anaerolineae bacterium]